MKRSRTRRIVSALIVAAICTYLWPNARAIDAMFMVPDASFSAWIEKKSTLGKGMMCSFEALNQPIRVAVSFEGVIKP